MDKIMLNPIEKRFQELGIMDKPLKVLSIPENIIGKTLKTPEMPFIYDNHGNHIGWITKIEIKSGNIHDIRNTHFGGVEYIYFSVIITECILKPSIGMSMLSGQELYSDNKSIRILTEIRSSLNTHDDLIFNGTIEKREEINTEARVQEFNNFSLNDPMNVNTISNLKRLC